MIILFLKTGSIIGKTDDFNKIVELLTPLGIQLYRTITEEGIGIYLTIDTDKFREKTKRNAGPKHKSIYIDNIFEEYSVEKVKELIKEHGGKEAAKMLHVSRATLYRRLKEAENINSEYIL